MAKNFVFWKQLSPIDREPVYTYMAVCSNSNPIELDKLPINDIFADLKTAFPNMVDKQNSKSVVLENSPVRYSQIIDGVVKDYRSEIKFTWNDQHVAVEFAGNVDDGTKATIINTLARFDCPLYDTYLQKRYDSEDGMSLGELPDLKTRRAEITQQAVRDLNFVLRQKPSVKRFRRNMRILSIAVACALGAIGFLVGSSFSPLLGGVGFVILGLIGFLFGGQCLFVTWYVIQRMIGTLSGNAE